MQQRSGGNSLVIIIILMVVAGLAYFDLDHPVENEPSQEAPSQNIPSSSRSNCAWLNGNDYQALSSSSSLDDCASQTYDVLTQTRRKQVFALWQNTELYVNSDGEVYTRQADSADSWEYAGTLENAGSGQSQQPVPTQRPQAQPTRQANTAPHDPLTLDQIFQLAEDDINDYWTQQFQNANSDYTKPDVVLYNQSRIRTGCGTVSEREGPLYCPNDHAAYFPRTFMQSELESVGDFAVVVVIAHEWGHAIQNLAGLYSNLSIETELQADCFAGAYSRYASDGSQRILLDDGDIDEGATAFYLFGDPAGTDYFDEQAHGSGQQRYQSFQKGLDNGYTVCLDNNR